LLEKKQFRDIFKVGIILFAITAVAALALAAVNLCTAPVISKNQKAKQDAAMKTVLPKAQAFSQIDSPDTVKELYLATDSAGNPAGVCVLVTTNGYGGAIDLVVGVDTEKKVTGVDIISQAETAGLGANAVKPEFKDQYIGKGNIANVVKNDAKANEINAISGATITSKAVTAGVNIAVEAAEDILSKEAAK
jgi:electron transport complex protein RnfG